MPKFPYPTLILTYLFNPPLAYAYDYIDNGLIIDALGTIVCEKPRRGKCLGFSEYTIEEYLETKIGSGYSVSALRYDIETDMLLIYYRKPKRSNPLK